MAQYTPARPTAGVVAPTLVQWRAVFAGAVVGLALMILLTLLWVALARATGVDYINNNLNWFVGGSAIFSVLIGGWLAGWLSGVRGASTGLMNGVTLWGLLVIITVLVATPSLVGGTNFQVGSLRGTDLWTGFWSVLIGLGAAAVGGLLGGIIPRAAAVQYEAPVYGRRDGEDGAYEGGVAMAPDYRVSSATEPTVRATSARREAPASDTTIDQDLRGDGGRAS